MIVMRDPKTFCFNFDWPKDVYDNLKHETEFIMKNNESLAENKIKNKIEQLLPKYRYRNNIHKHRKQQNEAHKFVLNLSQRLDLRSSSKMLLFKTYLFITRGKL